MAKDTDFTRAGLADAHSDEQNRLLRALPLAEYDRLLGEFRPVRLACKDVLIEPDTEIAYAWFLREGVGSMIAADDEGGQVEVGTIGNEGFIGLPLVNGVDRMAYQVIIQVAGEAWRIRADAFRRIVEERLEIRHLCLRYAQYFSDQMAQSVACNRLHTVEERCARWVLMTHDRVEGDQFELTHEFLAMMLGVRRAGVSVAMGILQRANVITYVRGRVTIVDRNALESAACGCYNITRRAQARLFGEPLPSPAAGR